MTHLRLSGSTLPVLGGAAIQHEAAYAATSTPDYSLVYPQTTMTGSGTHIPAGSDFSMSYVVKVSYTNPSGYAGSDTAQYLVLQPGNFYIIIRNNKIEVKNIFASDSFDTLGTALAADTWYQLDLTYNAGTKTMKLYVNGSPVKTYTFTGGFTAFTNLSIGWASGNAMNNQLIGKLGEVRWTTTELSAAQVSAGYLKRNSSISGLSGYAAAWSPNDPFTTSGGTTTIPDGSGHGRVLTTTTACVKSADVPAYT